MATAGEAIALTVMAEGASTAVSGTQPTVDVKVAGKYHAAEVEYVRTVEIPIPAEVVPAHLTAHRRMVVVRLTAAQRTARVDKLTAANPTAVVDKLMVDMQVKSTSNR